MEYKITQRYSRAPKPPYGLQVGSWCMGIAVTQPAAPFQTNTSFCRKSVTTDHNMCRIEEQWTRIPTPGLGRAVRSKCGRRSS